MIAAVDCLAQYLITSCCLSQIGFHFRPAHFNWIQIRRIGRQKHDFNSGSLKLGSHRSRLVNRSNDKLNSCSILQNTLTTRQNQILRRKNRRTLVLCKFVFNNCRMNFFVFNQRSFASVFINSFKVFNDLQFVLTYTN